MPLEIRCPTCGKTLRVGDQHAGRQVRCPACQQISVAPGPAPDGVSQGETPGNRQADWHMRTPEGQTFGPVSWSQVTAWVAEGRIAADCQLAENLAGPWRGAAEWFPNLTPLAPQKALQAAPARHDWLSPELTRDETAPFAPAAVGVATAGSGPTFVVPHRGGLILILGILAWAVNCPIFCFMAWVMGASDLREMRAGRMDKSGEGLTRVGMILGMIMSLFWIFIGLAVLVVLLVAAAGGG